MEARLGVTHSFVGQLLVSIEHDDGSTQRGVYVLFDSGGAADQTPDDFDNFPGVYNRDQADADGRGDVCDLCPCFNDRTDTDGDGIPDGCDLFGDSDQDGDVDLQDYADFVSCLEGPPIQVTGACAVFDAEGNLRVDLRDFGAFQREFGRSTCP